MYHGYVERERMASLNWLDKDRTLSDRRGRCRGEVKWKFLEYAAPLQAPNKTLMPSKTK
jgi:hypothetical protein